MSSNLIIRLALLMCICKTVVVGTEVCKPAKPQQFVVCGDRKCRCSETDAVCENRLESLRYIPKLPAGITRLYFWNNAISHLAIETFANISVSSIEVLSFMRNRVTTINRDAFYGFVKLQKLCLGWNDEMNTTQLSQSFGSLRSPGPLTLHLTNINLTELFDNFFTKLATSNLVKLDLSDNFIKVLNMAAFRQLENLTELILATNVIRDITFDTGLRSLSYLNLFENEIVGKMPNFCFFAEDIPLFPNLRRLNLMDNFIRELSQNSFKCLTTVKFLNLQRNVVSVLKDNVFGHMKQLKELQIARMKGGIQKIEPSAFNSSSLLELNLNTDNIVFHPKQNLTVFSLCSSLTKIDLSSNNLQKLLKKHLTTLLGPLRRLEKLIATHAKISYLPTNFLDNYVNLTYVNLAGNGISTIEGFFESTRNINTFSLQGNNIRVLYNNLASKTFLRSVKFLVLADNPFSCTCENMWFRSMINKNGNLTLGNSSLKRWPTSYHCDSPINMKYVKLQDYKPTESSCNPINYFIIVTVPLVVVLVSCLLTTFIVYRYRWYVKYWLYKLKPKKLNSENKPLLNTRFDAFVIYNTSDCDYVHQDFRELLEGAHAYKLHLWERDVTSGHDNFREMVAAIEASQSAIAIISKDSLDDGWFQFQLSVALDRQVELKRPYLMLVILENVDCERLSKFWCVLLTRLPTARWCPDKTDVKRTVFEQQLCNHLGNRSGR